MSLFISAVIFLVLLLAFTTHVFGLPANWIIIAILWIWDWVTPGASISLEMYLVYLGAALLGECIEFGLQVFGARKYGASRSGNWGAIAGAIAGAIFGVPFFFGLGALVGAVLGAYIGCLGIELMNGRPGKEARRAALGAMLGKVLGLAVKIGIGVVLLMQAFGAMF